MKQRKAIAIVGAGNLAHGLGQALVNAGYRVDEVVARAEPKSQQSARNLAKRLRAQAVSMDRARLDAPVVWFCVNDDAIAPAARALAGRKWKGKIALHSSGALGSDELQALRHRGAAVASLHPMMTFVAGEQPSLHGVPFAVEGGAAAVRVAQGIARDLGGDVFAIRKQAKPLYHALGSFSSPMIVATLATAERIAGAAGIGRARALSIMRPILRRTLDNYLANGATAAFSGPVQRGDVLTVSKHLEALRRVPGARETYVALVRSALRDIPVRDRRAVQRALAGKASRPKLKRRRR
jgi:predicted short-subunit dehydrogenase-like oxidoreductase (DUF2520 family)